MGKFLPQTLISKQVQSYSCIKIAACCVRCVCFMLYMLFLPSLWIIYKNRWRLEKKPYFGNQTFGHDAEVCFNFCLKSLVFSLKFFFFSLPHIFFIWQDKRRLVKIFIATLPSSKLVGFQWNLFCIIFIASIAANFMWRHSGPSFLLMFFFLSFSFLTTYGLMPFWCCFPSTEV